MKLIEQFDSTIAKRCDDTFPVDNDVNEENMEAANALRFKIKRPESTTAS